MPKEHIIVNTPTNDKMLVLCSELPRKHKITKIHKKIFGPFVIGDWVALNAQRDNDLLLVISTFWAEGLKSTHDH